MRGRISIAADNPFFRLGAICQLLLVAPIFMSSPLQAASIKIVVEDAKHAPVPEVVVTVSAPQEAVASQPQTSSMTMDQVKMQFVPEVLVVPVGARVAFPNSDTVSHQVYSFSPAKTFKLPLYKGSINPPLTFNKPGLVTLGCNIHDMMVGYIYVTSAPWYGQTNAHGQFIIEWVSASAVTISIWSPYLTDPVEALSKTVQVDAATDQIEVTFKLRKPIRSSPQPRPRRGDWDY